VVELQVTTHRRSPHVHRLREAGGRWDMVDRLLGNPTINDIQSEAQRSGWFLAADRRHADEIAGRNAWLARKATWAKLKERTAMTVSLYRSSATGARDIVVQTNAQSLDVFIDALADALDRAIEVDPQNRGATIAATLRNSFPIGFAIAGYKADKVTESKLLVCGVASLDAAELMAQSKL
jgi:hypothetical protein